MSAKHQHKHTSAVAPRHRENDPVIGGAEYANPKPASPPEIDPHLETVGDGAPRTPLASMVQRLIELDSELAQQAIRVVQKDGRLSLVGTVATAGQKSRALDLALDVAGVSTVHDGLAVAPPSGATQS